MSLPDFSSKSLQDLRGILRYISQDKPQAAGAFVAAVKERCHLLARFPKMGALREDLAPSLRAFSIGNYVIYYRPTEKGTRIERVLHGARDVDAEF